MTHPILQEINTRCWLRELSEQTGARITLANVPDSEFARWRELGFTHIWLMGVWTTGPRALESALNEKGLIQEYLRAFPDWKESDVGGSPYAIAEYKVARALGGENGLKKFRAKLHAHGMKLILDYVGNHVGLDHVWVKEQPDLFVHSPIEVPGTFAQETVTGVRWLAHGKDPNFAPWPDTAQLDFRRFATRAAMKDLLLSIAERCDGVRCDMAMLQLNETIATTWSAFPVSGEPPTQEFWQEAITATRQARPEFVFLAEVYWNLESRMIELGFDYAYDKGLYDKLVSHDGVGVQNHLLKAPVDFVSHGVHFLENHDEARIASAMTLEEHRAAALVILGLPGMRFLHEGQLTGARAKIPVQLLRRPVEPVDSDIQKLYEKLLSVLPKSAVGRGEFKLIKPTASWSGNITFQNFVIVQWQSRPEEFDLVVVNLSAERSQCFGLLGIPEIVNYSWKMRDLLGTESFERDGNNLAMQGIYLDLPAHGAQLFHFTPIA
jgi:glycosidase